MAHALARQRQLHEGGGQTLLLAGVLQRIHDGVSNYRACVHAASKTLLAFAEHTDVKLKPVDADPGWISHKLLRKVTLSGGCNALEQSLTTPTGWYSTHAFL